MSAGTVKYGHRNGDSAIPTEDGDFFFQGILNDRFGGDEHYDKPTIVDVQADDDSVGYPGHDEYRAILSKSVGYWWGPVEVPEAVTE